MDPNNVIIINNDIDIIAYKNFKVWTDCEYEEHIKVEFSKWEQHGIHVFVVHNSSMNQADQLFPVNVLADVINIIHRKFGFILKSSNLKYHDKLQNVKMSKSSLYITAVGLSNGKYTNILVDRFTSDEFTMNGFSTTVLPGYALENAKLAPLTYFIEFSVAEVHSEQHIKSVHTYTMKNLPLNCPYVIYTFLYGYNDEAVVSTESYKIHIIEAMTLNNKYIQNKEEHLNNLKDVLNDLKLCEENTASIIYVDESTKIEDSSHVVRFLREVCNIPTEETELSVVRKVSHISQEGPIDAQLEAPASRTVPTDAAEDFPPHSIHCKSYVLKLKRRYTKMLKRIDKEKEDIKKQTAREIIDMLNKSHNKLMNSQRQQFDEIINQTKQSYEIKIQSLNDYSKELLIAQTSENETLKKENEILKKENETLTNTVSVFQERLDSIHCLLMGGTPPPTQAQLPTQIQRKGEDTMRLLRMSLKKETNSINETIQQQERQIRDLKACIETIQADIKKKEVMLNNMIFQVDYYKQLKTEEENAKKLLEAENANLIKNLEDMQIRHNEQFKEYEKLLKRSRKDIDVHKREVATLRDHFQNFSPSPAVGRMLRLSNGLSNSTPDFRTTETPTPVPSDAASISLTPSKKIISQSRTKKSGKQQSKTNILKHKDTDNFTLDRLDDDTDSSMSCVTLSSTQGSLKTSKDTIKSSANTKINSVSSNETLASEDKMQSAKTDGKPRPTVTVKKRRGRPRKIPSPK